MKTKSKVIEQLTQEFELCRKAHEEHIRAVHVMYSWLDNNATPRFVDHIPSSQVNLNGVKGVITEVNIKGVPLFICELTILPYERTADIGAGPGNPYVMNF